MVKIRIGTEKIILSLFFIAYLFIGPAILFDYKIKHDFPYAYFASDAFQHQARAEAIKDAGNFRYEANYISLGFEKVVGRYPPLIYHLAAMLSHSAGIEVYDSIYFIIYFFAIAGIFVMYLIARDFSKNAALISLALPILAFSQPASTGFLFGHWPSLLAQFFLIAFAWCIMKIDLDKSYIFIAISLTSIALAHTSEAIFGLIFLALFLLIKLASKTLKKSDVKNIVIASIVSLIISSYYLVIFLNTWAKAQPYSFAVEPVWQGNPGFYMLNFGILLVFIAIGIVFSLPKIKNMHASIVLAFAMLLGGFMNYAGFSLRSFQIRFFWPIYLSIFFGIGVYMLLKLAVKNWNSAYTLAICIVFAVLLATVNAPLTPKYSPIKSQGIMDDYHWAALEWLSRNTGQDSRLYFFYGDIYSQDALLRNSKRVHYQVVPDDFVKSLNERKIKRYYVSELPGDGGGGLAVRKGIFNFEYADKDYPQEDFFGIRDICRFDYFIFDKASGQHALSQYNIIIASELMKKDYISKAFENEIVVILKNSKTGEDCIEERSF